LQEVLDLERQLAHCVTVMGRGVGLDQAAQRGAGRSHQAVIRIAMDRQAPCGP
jgi:hypothetical protein